MDKQSNRPKCAESKQTVEKACARTVLKKRLYSIKELACEIGTTEWFWRSLIRNGQLPYVQVGRKMFIDSNDVEKFINKHKATY
jgi:excisionase family DNA binding protein